MHIIYHWNPGLGNLFFFFFGWYEDLRYDVSFLYFDLDIVFGV